MLLTTLCIDAIHKNKYVQMKGVVQAAENANRGSGMVRKAIPFFVFIRAVLGPLSHGCTSAGAAHGLQEFAN